MSPPGLLSFGAKCMDGVGSESSSFEGHSKVSSVTAVKSNIFLFKYYINYLNRPTLCLGH